MKAIVTKGGIYTWLNVRENKFIEEKFEQSEQLSKEDLNEREQFMLRKIERLRFQGKSYKNICDFLNRNGYTNKSGSNFTKYSVGSIVKNRGFVVRDSGNTTLG